MYKKAYCIYSSSDLFWVSSFIFFSSCENNLCQFKDFEFFSVFGFHLALIVSELHSHRSVCLGSQSSSLYSNFQRPNYKNNHSNYFNGGLKIPVAVIEIRGHTLLSEQRLHGSPCKYAKGNNPYPQIYN